TQEKTVGTREGGAVDELLDVVFVVEEPGEPREVKPLEGQEGAEPHRQESQDENRRDDLAPGDEHRDERPDEVELLLDRERPEVCDPALHLVVEREGAVLHVERVRDRRDSTGILASTGACESYVRPEDQDGVVEL